MQKAKPNYMNKTILISIGFICTLIAAAGIMHYNPVSIARLGNSLTTPVRT